MSIMNEEEQKELWQIDVKEWRQQKGKVETCMVKTYAVICGQCTEAMQLEIKSDPEYESRSVKKNS
eukprot:102364-Ditylum_brightwellii.AAC.1